LNKLVISSADAAGRGNRVETEFELTRLVDAAARAAD
jgi:hypothetical protein